MSKIKLCGLKSEEDIKAANILKPEYIGFVFYEKSSRYVSPEKAKELKEILTPEIKSVGVFVNESPENVAKISNCGIIDVIQLHGNENEDYITRLRELTDKPIIKAFSSDNENFTENAEKSAADYVLFDSGKGGTGSIFDWEKLKSVKRRYFLAGGLSAENVSDAVKFCNPYAVDVSSGIETDGVKDKDKMTKFVKNARD